ncbi:Uncharacterised protein [Brevundimonas vesicularis]|uniref:Uncharacterized protein n=1 Tax=Brevundimonas vesicularis TaxID=41276 RepID=A0A2X1DBQ8_BREVE|nr:Uncharacterised protein [Brevundimonas vesicularis]
MNLKPKKQEQGIVLLSCLIFLLLLLSMLRFTLNQRLNGGNESGGRL